MNIRMDLSDLIGLYAKASLTILNRLSDRFVESFRSIFSVDEDLKFSYFRERGIDHARGRRYRQAIDILAQLNSLRPDDHEIAIYLGVSLLKLGQEERGLLLLEQAYRGQLQLGEDVQRVAAILSAAYKRLGAWEPLIALLQEQINRHPKQSAPYRQLADCYAEQQQFNLAVTLYRKVIILEPKNAADHYRLSTLLQRVGEEAESLTVLARAKELETAQS